MTWHHWLWSHVSVTMSREKIQLLYIWCSEMMSDRGFYNGIINGSEMVPQRTVYFICNILIQTEG